MTIDPAVLEKAREAKTCIACGNVFYRKDGDRNSNWIVKQVCGFDCRHLLNHKRAEAKKVRRCSLCLRILPKRKFALRRRAGKRFVGRKSRCVDCDRVYFRARYKAIDRFTKINKRKPNYKKRKATHRYQTALRNGTIIPQPCEICGQKAQGHHEYYRRPLVVRWLCRTHHAYEHRKPTNTPVTEDHVIRRLKVQPHD